MHVIDDAYSGADGVRLEDINKDGLMDIATGWEEEGITKVYLHPGSDKVTLKWPSVIVGNSPSVEDAVFFDMNDDGQYDVISSTEGKNRKIIVHWSKGSGDYLNTSNWKSEELPSSVDVMQ